MTTYPFPFRAEHLPSGAYWVRSGSDGWDFRAVRLKSDGTVDPLLEDPDDPDENKDWVCHNRPIYAAAAGVVYASWRNAPEHLRPGVQHPGRANMPQTIPRSGNFVAVLGDDGHAYAYAHLKTGTVPSSLCPFEDEFVADANDKISFDIPYRKVIVGTLIPSDERPRVERGQFLGRTGHSGASSNPHLHWHQRDENNQVIRFSMDRAWRSTKANPDHWTKFKGEIIDENDSHILIHASPLLRRAHTNAESFSKLAIHFTRTKRFVTAIRMPEGNLKLDTWGITTDSKIEHRGEKVVGKITEVTITEPRSDLVATAVRLENGKMRVIVWRIETSGEPTRLNHATTSGKVTSIALIRIKTGLIITAVRLENGNMKIIAWSIASNGAIDRRGEENAGGITAVHATRTPAIDNGFVTAVRLTNGRLKLIGWETSDNGESIFRRGEVTSDEVSDIAIMHRGSGGKFLVTAVRDATGKLLVKSWEITSGGDQFTLRASARGGSISELDMVGLPDPNLTTVVACRTSEGRLKLICWELDADGKGISRLAGAHAGRASKISITANSDDDRNYFIVACALPDGNLRLISWEANLAL